MERDQKAKDRAMDTAEARAKEKVNPPARKKAGEKADVKCRKIAWNRHGKTRARIISKMSSIVYGFFKPDHVCHSINGNRMATQENYANSFLQSV